MSGKSYILRVFSFATISDKNKNRQDSRPRNSFEFSYIKQ